MNSPPVGKVQYGKLTLSDYGKSLARRLRKQLSPFAKMSAIGDVKVIEVPFPELGNLDIFLSMIPDDACKVGVVITLPEHYDRRTTLFIQECTRRGAAVVGIAAGYVNLRHDFKCRYEPPSIPHELLAAGGAYPPGLTREAAIVKMYLSLTLGKQQEKTLDLMNTPVGGDIHPGHETSLLLD